jgi:hypothetical protein
LAPHRPAPASYHCLATPAKPGRGGDRSARAVRPSASAAWVATQLHLRTFWSAPAAHFRMS